MAPPIFSRAELCWGESIVKNMLMIIAVLEKVWILQTDENPNNGLKTN